MQDLYAEISELDKKRLDNYTSKWGSPQHTIPMEEYLSYWNKNKRKMFKLLGNKLIYSCDFEYKKPDEEIKFEFNKLLKEDGNSVIIFLRHFESFMDWIMRYLSKQYNIPSTAEELNIFRTIMYYNPIDAKSLSSNELSFSVKSRLRNKQNELRLQKGGKLLKAIAKILKYYEEEIKYWQKDSKIDLFLEFEDFRILHSRILNDKKVKGKLNISIHPLDFMTMSDNNNKWSSCMSWQENGCYRAGTVEMMNSNNVLCCYISSDNVDFKFQHKQYDSSLLEIKENETEDWSWNNKKWRQLVYFTKDIIVGEKSYPYQNDAIAQKVIEVIRKLAKDNLGWTYTYGPELYKDMKYIESEYAINRARNYRKYNPRKKNIIFDTKAMYNDLICHYPNLHYWCCRNKVEKTKIICVSGPTKCLCCGGEMLEENEYHDDGYEYDLIEQYHDRYLHTFSVVCRDCLDKYYCCYHCGENEFNVTEYHIVNYDGKDRCLCDDCYKQLTKCPECGEWYYLEQYSALRFIVTERELSAEFIKKMLMNKIEDPWLEKDPKSIILCGCQDCLKKAAEGWISSENFEKEMFEELFHLNVIPSNLYGLRFLPKTDVNDEKWSRFKYENRITYKASKIFKKN